MPSPPILHHLAVSMNGPMGVRANDRAIIDSEQASWLAYGIAYRLVFLRWKVPHHNQPKRPAGKPRGLPWLVVIRHFPPQ